MDCAVCQDKFKIFDLVYLADCGHHFHNLCFLRSKSEKCHICRRVILDSFNFFTTSADFDFFNNSNDNNSFTEQIAFTRDRHRDIEEQDINEKRIIYKEKINNQKFIIYDFFKSNLHNFKFKISYDEKYKNLPVVFILKGPKNDINYFNRNCITSIVDYLNNYFKLCEFYIHSDIILKKNYIMVKFIK
jgi:hypothetical protein